MTNIRLGISHVKCRSTHRSYDRKGNSSSGLLVSLRTRFARAGKYLALAKQWSDFISRRLCRTCLGSPNLVKRRLCRSRVRRSGRSLRSRLQNLAGRLPQAMSPPRPAEPPRARSAMFCSLGSGKAHDALGEAPMDAGTLHSIRYRLPACA